MSATRNIAARFYIQHTPTYVLYVMTDKRFHFSHNVTVSAGLTFSFPWAEIVIINILTFSPTFFFLVTESWFLSSLSSAIYSPILLLRTQYFHPSIFVPTALNPHVWGEVSHNTQKSSSSFLFCRQITSRGIANSGSCRPAGTAVFNCSLGGLTRAWNEHEICQAFVDTYHTNYCLSFPTLFF